MRRTVTGTAALLAACLFAAIAAAEPASSLKPAEEFGTIRDETARSVALFEEMGRVLTHPRCLNCHPVGDTPLQGDGMEPHRPAVTRFDESGMGPPAMRCTTCHGRENFAFVGAEGSIPGHEPWHLAPKEAGWVGVPLGEICRQLKDPERNGGRTLDEIHEHNATDGLVGWGWRPGEGRTPVPGTQAQFGELTRAWIETGAHCPE